MMRPDQVVDRIENAENIQDQDHSIFLLGPVEHLVDVCADVLRATPEWAALYGCTADDPGSIDTYKRMDYDVRQLPALRIYNETQDKQFDSWFITGDLVLDMIWPASLRRQDLQRIPDTVANAMLQQFRRVGPFFNSVSDKIPGLNELGKSFNVDKSMGFEWGENILPLTQIRANFRIDLRIWDDYLNSVGRTKDDPFNVTLGDLRRVVTTIQALRDDGTIETTVPMDQDLETTEGD